MGRPLNNLFFGDTTKPGAQIALSECWIPSEDSSNQTSYIIRQVGTNTFLARNSESGAEGFVRLTDGEVNEAGMATIEVSRPGTGSGAEAHVLMTATTITLTNGGTGYQVGDVLTLSSGETVTVDAVETVEEGEEEQEGIVTAVSLTTVVAVSSLNTEAQTVTGGTGSGCTITVTGWKVSDVIVDNGGEGYSGVSATVAGATVDVSVVDGVVAAISVVSSEEDLTAIPNVVFSATDRVEHARAIHAHKVYTYEGNVYLWRADKALLDENYAVLPIA